MTISLTSSDVGLLRTAMVQMLSPYSASSERSWLLGVTAVLKKLLGADKASTRVLKDNRMGVISEDIDNRALSAFAEYYYRFDAGGAVPGSVSRLPRVWTVEESYSDRLRDFYRSEYYNDFHIPWKTFHGLCVSNKRNPGPLDGVMYFHREKCSAPEFDARAKAILRIFSPALRAGLRHGFPTAPVGELLSTIDQMSDGCALATLSGILLHRNPALSSLIETGQDDGKLLAGISAAVSAIGSLKSKRISDILSAGAGPEHVLVGNRRYALNSCCLGHFAGIPEPLVLVFITPAERGNTFGWMRANHGRFGLTPREREVAILLAERKTNREIASRLGISPHTARHHSERVIGKLGRTRKWAGNSDDSGL